LNRMAGLIITVILLLLLGLSLSTINSLFMLLSLPALAVTGFIGVLTFSNNSEWVNRTNYWFRKLVWK